MMPARSARSLIASLVVLGALAAGCSGAGNEQRPDADSLVAAVASYDLVVDRPGRFIVGLYSADQSRVLAYGTVSLVFTYLGTREETAGAAIPPIGPVDAVFLPIPGQDVDPNTAGPKLVAGSEATGVYGAHGVEFSQPGFWEVAVTADLDGGVEETTGAFEVLADSAIPAVGEQAPLTRQPLAGDKEADPKSIDSRASADRPIPDPGLHDVTIADAIAAGRPLMVVVSTPTFCVSRFCGPITDSVEELDARFGDEMDFIHLEVWEDFQSNALNPAAAEWIAPTPETEGGEPWVFVVDTDGIIVARFDNVATDSELLAAVEAVLR